MHPTLFSIPLPFLGVDIPIHSYGFMVVVGFLAGLYLARERARREGVDPLFFTDLGTILLLAGLVGARIAYILEDPSGYTWQIFNVFDLGLSPIGALAGGLAGVGLYYQLAHTGNGSLRPATVAAGALIGTVIGARIVYVLSHPAAYEYAFEIFKVYRGGLSSYGGLIMAAGAGIAYCIFHKQKIPLSADIAAPSLALGLAFGRIGCFLNGCCFGKVTASCLGIAFPGDGRVGTSPAWLHHFNLGLIESASPYSLPVHPTQLYHSAADLALFAVLAVYWRLSHRPGQVFLMFGILYPLGRFFIEGLRDDMTRTAFGLTPYQILAVPIFAICLLWWLRLQFKPGSDVQT
jgi:phosphatidylglycerol:prolipoprotein diacylglycerol transferase